MFVLFGLPEVTLLNKGTKVKEYLWCMGSKGLFCRMTLIDWRQVKHLLFSSTQGFLLLTTVLPLWDGMTLFSITQKTLYVQCALLGASKADCDLNSSAQISVSSEKNAINHSSVFDCQNDCQYHQHAVQKVFWSL